MPDVTININGRGVVGGGSDNGGSGTQSQPRVGSNGQPAMPTSGGSNVGNAQPAMPTSSTTTSGTPAGGTPAMPTYDRMAQDIRREIMSRGCLMVPGSSNFNQLMNQVTSQYKDRANSNIDAKYDDLRQSISQNRQSEVDALIASIDAKREKAIEKRPEAADEINANFDKVLEGRLSKIDKKYLLQYTDLEDNAQNERAAVDKELAKIAGEIVQEMKRGNPNSYMARLRTEMGEARWKRDNAETEEEVQDASREMAAIQRRMARATSVRNPLQRFQSGWGAFTTLAGAGMQAYNTYLQNEGREIGIVNQAANGDAFGAMQSNLERIRANYAGIGGAIGMGVGGLIGGIGAAAGSWGIGTGAGAAAGAGVGGGVGTWIGNNAFNLIYGEEVNQAKLGSMWADQEKRLNAYSQLALIARGNGNVANVRDALFNQFNANDTEGYAWGGLTPHDLGYTNSDFSIQAAQRARSRGYYTGGANGAVLTALEEDALEKAYNMNQGSLSQLGSYDRYRRSNNATQDVANLVASLDRRGVWGMSGGQYLRTNEFVNYQTQLMEMQKRYMMHPSSEYAQRQLLAAQNVYGDALDSRGIQAMGQIDNAITSPQEGYSKAILYDVIQNSIAGTRGNLLAIRKAQYSDDPEIRMKIQKGMFDRLTQIYGGVDTTSGYLAMSQYTGIQNPTELRKWVNQMRSGLPGITKGDKSAAADGLKGYTQEVSKQMLQYQDQTVAAISENLSNLKDVSQTMLTTFKKQLNDIIGELSKANN